MQIEHTELNGKFPKQLLPFSQKGNKWRAQCVYWGASKNVMTYSPIRKSVRHKQINYDLLNGKLHMDDLQMIVNPNNMQAGFIPNSIQHYPIMNTKLQILQGEESKRVFDDTLVITNPNTITEIDKAKTAEYRRRIQELIENNKGEDQQAIQELADYMNYRWKDLREIRGNALLNHFKREQNFPLIFNKGFMDALAVGEEIYQCTIIQGEPKLLKLNPRKVRVYQSGYSNKIEDADMIVIEDYWNPGRIIDTYGDILKPDDIKKIESMQLSNLGNGTSENYDERDGYIKADEASYTAEDLFPSNDSTLSDMPYDFSGNIRVCQVFWKSKRRIKKVKSYDPITGEEVYNLYDETYIINKDKGETETIIPINQAWEGTMIGDNIFVNMGPCPVQYNKISNPSLCHFGIIGSIYNLNDDTPFSLVDIMKPYNYLYDVVYDKLNRLIARNHGKIIRLDLAKVPDKWNVDKWLTVLKTAGIAVEDSFKEGNKGMATGKLAGSLNNASSGVVDAELGQSIQQHISLLEYIKNEMGEVAGISRQREGQISNRETVGGVERATLQSSHITEWLFMVHDDVKKRVLECFLETCKVALRGRNMKFQYITPEQTQVIVDLDGNEFAESDYGLVIDNSSNSQELKNNLPVIVQAGLQNSAISFSTALKIWSSASLAEKTRMIEADERKLQERQSQMAQQQNEAQQQIAQMNQQTEMAKMEQEDKLNQRDNDTKILIATLNAQNKESTALSEVEQLKLEETQRQFNERLSLDKERLKFDKEKTNKDLDLKKQQLNKKSASK